MKNKSASAMFALGVTCYGIVAMIWYRVLLFRCIHGMTYTQSYLLLWAMTVVFAVLGFFVFLRNMPTGIAILSSLTLPLGIYTVITYFKSFKSAVLIAALITLLLTASYIIFIIVRRIRVTGHPLTLKKRHIRKFLTAFQLLSTVSLLVIMLIPALNVLLYNDVRHASVPAIKGTDSREQTISANIDTILLLQDDEWKGLTTQQKLDVLQTVANIEAHYLGLPNELNVSAVVFDDGIHGAYIDSTRRICVNIECLENDTGFELLSTCCHEAFHSYQHRLVDAYNTADNDYKALRIYHEAISYEQEFSDYNDGSTDYISYFGQKCEIDARNYAQDAVFDYNERIAEYLFDRNFGTGD